MVEKFVSECPVCQLVKVDRTHPSGLLQPLPIPGHPWESISMDFIEALPNSNGKEVILVIVDRLTKYSHFIALSHPYSVETIIYTILDSVVRLHGPPKEIISDRDRIFTSTLYQEIFHALNVQLKFSTAYHPQTDGQMERFNQCLKSYLRSMVFLEPKKWNKWLPMAEWWYNTSYHSSIRVNCKKPPHVGLGLQKTTTLQFFCKNQSLLNNLVTKTTDYCAYEC
jgi:transposase InsO family protein